MYIGDNVVSNYRYHHNTLDAHVVPLPGYIKLYTVLHRDTDVWQSQLPARPSQLPARPSKMTGAAI